MLNQTSLERERLFEGTWRNQKTENLSKEIQLDEKVCGAILINGYNAAFIKDAINEMRASTFSLDDHKLTFQYVLECERKVDDKWSGENLFQSKCLSIDDDPPHFSVDKFSLTRNPCIRNGSYSVRDLRTAHPYKLIVPNGFLCVLRDFNFTVDYGFTNELGWEYAEDFDFNKWHPTELVVKASDVEIKSDQEVAIVHMCVRRRLWMRVLVAKESVDVCHVAINEASKRRARGVVKEGIMMKIGKIIPSWKTRFFSLNDSVLEYYSIINDETSPRKKKGEFLLNECSIIDIQLSMESPFEFTLLWCDGTKRKIQVANRSELLTWIFILHHQIGLINSPSKTNIPPLLFPPLQVEVLLSSDLIVEIDEDLQHFELRRFELKGDHIDHFTPEGFFIGTIDLKECFYKDSINDNLKFSLAVSPACVGSDERGVYHLHTNNDISKREWKNALTNQLALYSKHFALCYFLDFEGDEYQQQEVGGGGHGDIHTMQSYNLLPNNRSALTGSSQCSIDIERSSTSVIPSRVTSTQLNVKSKLVPPEVKAAMLVFGVSTPAVFVGFGVWVNKKSSEDITGFKKRLVWIDPEKMSLCWSKGRGRDDGAGSGSGNGKAFALSHDTQLTSSQQSVGKTRTRNIINSFALTQPQNTFTLTIQLLPSKSLQKQDEHDTGLWIHILKKMIESCKVEQRKTLNRVSYGGRN